MWTSSSLVAAIRILVSGNTTTFFGRHCDRFGPTRTTARSVSFAEPAPRRSPGDDWSERGERGRWVRVHVEPRQDKFDPWRAPRCPCRKTRLKPWRTTQGIYENGNDFQEKDERQFYNTRKHQQPRSVSPLWMGRRISIVDRGYSKEYGTDQRRQRETVANLSEHHTSCEHFIMPDP